MQYIDYGTIMPIKRLPLYYAVLNPIFLQYFGGLPNDLNFRSLLTWKGNFCYIECDSL